MSDRKYRQRGYQDDHRPRQPPSGDREGERGGGRPDRPPGAPAGARRISSEGARNPNMPGYRQVARCARCGALVDSQVFSKSACGKCGQMLRACVQCVHFDPGARFECTQSIPARVSPKDAANECTLYAARTSWERETSSVTGAATQDAREPSGARKAFDDLFKF
ncbi:MAG: hypothetical protein AB1635_00500 [Acidobacteriota bacterium]